jgi:hypothetical protein
MEWKRKKEKYCNAVVNRSDEIRESLDNFNSFLFISGLSCPRSVKTSKLKIVLKVVTNEKGEALGEVLTIIC